MTISHMTFVRGLALTALVALGGCNADRLNVPSYNDPAVGPSDRPLMQNLASGILAEQRGGMAGLISNVGIFGRESYNYTGSEPRNVTLFLSTFPLDNSGFTNGQWDPRFRNIRNALNLIGIAEGAAFLTDAEKNAVRGFANTMRALDLFYVIATRDTLGAPTAIDLVGNTAQTFDSRDSVYRFISATPGPGQQPVERGGRHRLPVQPDDRVCRLQHPRNVPPVQSGIGGADSGVPGQPWLRSSLFHGSAVGPRRQLHQLSGGCRPPSWCVPHVFDFIG